MIPFDPAAPAPVPSAAPPRPAPISSAPPILPLPPEDRLFWDSEVERAEKLRNDTIQAWDSAGNLERYTPKTVMTEGRTPDMKVNVAKDFSDTERKKAALFYDTPKVALIPDAGTPSPALLLHQEVMNQLLGPKRMNCKATVLPMVQDCLVVLQPSPSEIGYTSVSSSVPRPDPVTGQPMVDPLGQPVMAMLTVWEDFFWSRISPKAILVPQSFRSTRYDDAPWLGYRWRKPVSQAKREYQLPEDVQLADSAKEKPYFEPLQGQTDDGEPQCTGVKLWYRASLRDPNVSHPLVLRELVLCDGLPEPAVHRNCPCQEIGPDGRLTQNSMVGYPLHPLALRDLTDSAYIAPDCTVTGPLTHELNKFRTQIIERRDGSKLHVFIDAAKISPEVRDKVGKGGEPKMIPVEPGALDGGAERLMAQVPAIELGRESYLGQDIIERDRAQILGIDANQVGAQNGSAKTATEVSTVQRNADARFEQERQRVLEWWLLGVQKVSALVLRYGDRLAMEILGPQRGKAWVDAKNQGMFGAFTYEVVIDSGAYVDIEARKRQDMQLYNMTAQDPATHHEELLVRLATDFGLDPTRWIVTEKPEAKPDPPTLSISVKPEDLDPALPSYVGTYAILTAGGVKGLPPPLTMAQPPPPGQPAPHGGMAELAPRLNQHQLSESGQQPGPAV